MNNENFKVVEFTTFEPSTGKNAVLISEDDSKNIEETLSLSSISGYIKNINDIKNNENWDDDKEYKKDEEW